MITRIIAAVYLLVVAGLAASIEIRGDYAGDGDFTIRGSLGGQTVATGGRNASMAYGQILTDSGAFAGLDMDGEGGSFRMIGNFGVSHLAQASGGSVLMARARVEDGSSVYALTGVGTYRERIIQAVGCHGNPAYLAEVDMTGSFDVNSSVSAPAETELFIEAI